MSLATWKREFYTPISKVAKRDAAKASLRKWEGLRPENMKRHGVEWFGYSIKTVGGPLSGFIVDDSSCALCDHFFGLISTRFQCETCPLSIVRGGIACDRQRSEERDDPYYRGIDEHDPHPMIRWLKKAVVYQERQARKKGARHATP